MRWQALRFDEIVQDATFPRVTDQIEHRANGMQRVISDASVISTTIEEDTNAESNIEPWDTFLDPALFEESYHERRSQELLSVSGQNVTQQQLLRDIYIASNNLSRKGTVWKTSLLYRMLKDDRLLPHWIPERSPVAQAIARTLLPEAIASHDVPLVKTLLLTGIDLNSSLEDYTRKTPLNLTIDEDNVDMTRLLLDLGADANFYGRHAHPLIQAVEYGRLGVVSLLIQYGADINAHSNQHPLMNVCYCYSPLTIAASNGHIWLVRLLIANGANINANHSADAPLRAAASSGRTEVVRLLLDMGAVDTHSAMAGAAFHGYEDIVEVIANRRSGDFSETSLDTKRLHAAVRAGNTRIVQKLLASGVRDDSSGTIWKSALSSARQPHAVNIVQLLLRHGTKATWDCLFKAMLHGNVQVAELLLQFGVQIDDSLKLSYAPGIHAEMVKLLLRHGLDLRIHGKEFLWHAVCVLKSLDVARLILAHAEYYDGLDLVSAYDAEEDDAWGSDCDTSCDPPEKSYSLLSLASKIYDHDAAFNMSFFLFSKGAKIMDGPLQIAAANGHQCLVEFLIDKGADINAVVAPVAGCLTALGGATRTGDLNLIHLLLSLGAKATGTELRAAVSSNNIPVTQLYISLGADVNAPLIPHRENLTALQLAASGGDLELVRVLLDAGADVEYQVRDDRYTAYTALQEAVERGAIDVVKELVQRGADVNAPAIGKYGHTALELAALVGHLDLVQLLINLQAETQGSRALDLALENGHCGVATLLRGYMSQEEGRDSREIREVSAVS